jgi:hypothetical protein
VAIEGLTSGMVRQLASAFGRLRAATCKVRLFKRVLRFDSSNRYRCLRIATRLAVLPSAAIEVISSGTCHTNV